MHRWDQDPCEGRRVRVRVRVEAQNEINIWNQEHFTAEHVLRICEVKTYSGI